MAIVLQSTMTKLFASRRKQLVMLAAFAAASAQGSWARRSRHRFTKQGLLITNFAPAKGTTMKVARRATDAVRSRLGKLVNKRDVDVIQGGDIALRLERSSFNPDTAETLDVIRSLARYLRADEFILGGGVEHSDPHLDSRRARLVSR